MLRTQTPPSRAVPRLHFVLKLLQASATMNYTTMLIFKMNNKPLVAITRSHLTVVDYCALMASEELNLDLNFNFKSCGQRL